MAQTNDWVVQIASKTLVNNVPSIVYSVKDGAGNLIVSGAGIQWASIEAMATDILEAEKKVESAVRIVLGDAFPNGVFSQTEWNKISVAPFGIKVNCTTAKVNWGA